VVVFQSWSWTAGCSQMFAQWCRAVFCGLRNGLCVSYCWPSPLDPRPLGLRARHEASQLETLGLEMTGTRDLLTDGGEDGSVLEIQ